MTHALAYVMECAKTMLQDWKTARLVRCLTCVTQRHVGNSKWSKPSVNIFKCNIDVSFAKQTNKVVIGICIRDETCNFVLAKTEWFESLYNVHVGEALGLLTALKWVHELILRPIDLELHAKKVVDSFSSSKNDITEFGMIIKKCTTLFTQYYVNSSVEFVQKQANETIHKLFKTTTLSTTFYILVEISIRC